MLFKNFKIAAFAIIVGLVSNCADTLLTAEGFAGKQNKGCAQPSAVTTTIGGTPTVYEAVVDATCETAWTYYDFDTRAVLSVSNPTADTTWELAFQRFKVKINGGVSGGGGETVVPIWADNFDSRTNAPGTFLPALTDVDDPAGDPNSACRPAGVKFAFLDTTATPQNTGTANACWLAYNTYGTHTLDPRDIAYVLKTTTPSIKYYKIKMLSYYSATGTSGMMKFRWAEVAP